GRAPRTARPATGTRRRRAPPRPPGSPDRRRATRPSASPRVAIAPEEVEPAAPGRKRRDVPPGRRRPRVPRVRIPQRIWSPPGHWKLFVFYMVVLFAVVGFQGFATHTIGPGTEGTHASAAPLASARPILAARGPRLAPIMPPAGRRVALTFDDGPNPRWTPPIAAELRRAGVPATFFLIGSAAARFPN